MQLNRRQALSFAAMGISSHFLGCGSSRSDPSSKDQTKLGRARERIEPISVAESWKRIAAWHEEHAPPGKFKLNPGASAEAIRSFEATIGTKLPEDFRESLRLHDGGSCWILWYGELLTLDRIEQQWREYRDRQASGDYAVDGDPSWAPLDIDGPIKPVFWNTKRIYVTDNSGDHLTLDLDPPEDGPLRTDHRTLSRSGAAHGSGLELGGVFDPDCSRSRSRPLCLCGERRRRRLAGHV